MSVEAISWALNLAPIPSGRGGQLSSACKFVLVGLANHADPDGGAAFPSVATLVRYTGLSERTVRTCLDRLEGEGIIRPCDPGIIAARIKRADRRPKGWDLDLAQVRGDLTKADLVALGRQFPGLPARVAAVADSEDADVGDGVQSPHPAGVVDNGADGVQPLHPATGTGCNQRGHGVQWVQPRGAVAAPEPSMEPSREPSAAPDGGGRPREFFDALGPIWPLTAAQRVRLTPAVLAALDEGWTPQGLAGAIGTNTDGIRNPYAVLAARLSAAELPPPSPASVRPPWCGECDQTTRMLGFHSDAPHPCPRCKPASARGRDYSRPCRR